MKRIRPAFTLIELLVAIAIAAILAATLFPVFAHAREKRGQANSLSRANDKFPVMYQKVPRSLVLGFNDATNSLTVTSHPISGLQRPPEQRFIVESDGHIRNVDLGANGYLTRVRAGNTIRVQFAQLREEGKDQDQVWHFKAGPNLPPGAGLHGNDKDTVVVAGNDESLLLTGQGVGKEVVVQARLPKEEGSGPDNSGSSTGRRWRMNYVPTLRAKRSVSTATTRTTPCP